MNEVQRKFKPGDWVICLSDASKGFHKGGIYAVRKYDRYPGSTSVPIVEDDDGSTENGWHHRFFIHLDPEAEYLWKLLNEN